MAVKGDHIVALDIGSTKIRIAVGQHARMAGSVNEPRLNIIATQEVNAEGIHRGIITSIDDAVACINQCIEGMERTLGVPLEHVWLGISGSHISCQESKGVIAVSKSDGEIQSDDVDRAIEAAGTVATPTNYEILHVIPRNFTIDDQSNIKDPLGMTGIRLEVDALIIQGLSSQIKNLTKCVYRSGLEIQDVVLSVLAASQAVLNNRQRDLGVALIDIGGTTTSLIVMEEGDVVHTAVLPVGSEHITADIAIGLRVSIDTAERIKLEYGTANPKDCEKSEMINLQEIDSVEEDEIPRKYIAEIIEARVEEIFRKVDQELERVDRSGMLPAGAVLIGGGAKLPGIVDLAKKRLRLPVQLGFAQNILSSVDKTFDLAYLTAIGLVVWGDQALKQRKTGRLNLHRMKSVVELTSKVRRWLRSLVP